MKFFRGAAAAAVGYAFSDEARTLGQRADDYYRADGPAVVERLTIGSDGTLERDALDPDAYGAWVEGRDPITGELRGRPRCDQARALRFVEVTVNGPKTWTVAAELHPDVAAAYEAAQDNAVEILARMWAHRCTTRAGAGGNRQERLGQIEVVAVRHHTSRAGDPHRHVHVQLNARVLRADGRWRGLDSTAFRDMIGETNGLGHLVMAADPGFRGALAGHGYRLGAGGEITELASAATVLSKRHTQIERNLTRFEQRWRAEHPGEEPTPELRRTWDHDAWLQGRPSKDPRTPPEPLTARWLTELAAAGIDVEAEQHRAGHLLLDGVPVGQVYRDQLATDALQRIGATRSTWNEHDLAGAVCVELADLALVGARPAIGELVEDCATRALARCISVDDHVRPVAAHVRHLTSPEVVACWTEIQDRLTARSQPGAPAADALLTEAQGLVRRRSRDPSEGTLMLDDGQIRAARAVAGTAPLVNVEGAAGTGKTTMLAVATQAISITGGRVVLVAPSAKAAKVAERETGAPGGTLAKLIHEHGWRWNSAGRMTRLHPGDPDPTTGTTYQGPSPDWRLGSGTTVIVDEAGMVDQDTARALLTVADETGARLVHVGDRAQLPPIGRGGYLQAATSCSPPIEMAEIHRFGHHDRTGRWVRDDAYAYLTHQMRTGLDPATVFDTLHQRGQVHVHHDPAAAHQAITRAWTTAHERGETTTVVVATNHEAATIAGHIRAQLVARGEVDDTRTVAGRDGNPIGAGDRIVTRRNDTTLSVLNREDWHVQTVHPDDALTVRGGLHDRTIQLPASYVTSDAHLAYATTDYGSQGSTTHHAIVALTDATTAPGLYVGMTRGRYTNTAHIIATGIDEARRQWIDATGRDRADQGLTTEIATARQAIRQAPTPPVQPELPFAVPAQPDRTQVDREVARLVPLAQLLDSIDKATHTLDQLDRQAATQRHRLAQARERFDAFTVATGPKGHYRAALEVARAAGDHDRAQALEHDRTVPRQRRPAKHSTLRAQGLAAQRALNTTLEQAARHREVLVTARDQLAGHDVPNWLHQPSQRTPAAIEAHLRGQVVAPPPIEYDDLIRYLPAPLPNREPGIFQVEQCGIERDVF